MYQNVLGLRQPHQQCSDCSHGEIVHSEFLEAHGNPPVALDLLEESFDQRSLLVHMPIDLTWGRALASRNHRHATLAFDQRDDLFRVVPLVGKDIGAVHACYQRFRLGNVVDLTFGQQDAAGIAQGVHSSVYLRGRSASRMPDRL
jgi:hypothetical protein